MRWGFFYGDVWCDWLLCKFVSLSAVGIPHVIRAAWIGSDGGWAGSLAKSGGQNGDHAMLSLSVC